MVEIQVVSDLHLETPKSYDIFDIEPRAPCLALLGDIGYIKHEEEYLDFLRRHLLRFRIVFLVLGNHEPWHSTWDAAKETARRFESLVRQERCANPDLGELILLDQNRYEFPSDDSHGGGGGLVILGCTLFSKVPPQSVEAVTFGLADFYNTDDWTVEQHNAKFESDLAWLNQEIRQLEGTSKKVAVLTHYSPTLDPRTVDPGHQGSSIQSGFASDLAGEPCWESRNVGLWAFGHTHFNCDFIDEGTGKRVLANQRGYYFRQANGFETGGVVKL